MKQRLDQILVEKEWAKTRSQGQLLIKAGKVKVDHKVVTRAGFMVEGENVITVEKKDDYVGRGALKIKAAVEHFKIEVEGKIIADCGASTGGFTDYLLRNRATKSYCIDVGHGQLDPSLQVDERVVNMEGVNLKNPLELPEKVDLVVADLSFISLKLVLPTLKTLLKEGGEMLLLFKPQFEVGKGKVNKKGIVTNDALRQKTLEAFKKWCKEEGFIVKGVIDSPIEGKQGNQEYLIWV